MGRKCFRQVFPLERQAEFTLVDVFRESLEYTRNYTLPFNMISVCIRSEGADASVTSNLKTGEIYRARENDISLIPHGLAQQYAHTVRNERYGIHFKLELYPGVDVFSGGLHRICENSPSLRKEADEIFAEPDPVLMLSRCREFALRFCHRHWPERYELNPDKIRPFEELLNYIRGNVHAELGVAGLAERMHRSAGSFSREFHAAFRQTPKQYLQNELYRKAAQMLQDPSESVKTVAEKLNFSSEFYFSKFFKRLSGISPRAYRARTVFSCR